MSGRRTERVGRRFLTGAREKAGTKQGYPACLLTVTRRGNPVLSFPFSTALDVIAAQQGKYEKAAT